MRHSLAAVLVAAAAGVALAAAMFEEPPADYKLKGAVATSDKKSARGLVYTTLGKPLKIYDLEKKKFIDFTLEEIARIDVEIEEEHEEPYWYWLESGSDEKVYTGKTYPWRKYLTTVTFSPERKITGHLSGLIHVDCDDKKTSFTLYERQKGKEGQKLEELVYVKSVVIGETADVEEGAAAGES